MIGRALKFEKKMRKFFKYIYAPKIGLKYTKMVKKEKYVIFRKSQTPQFSSNFKKFFIENAWQST